jgi:hypothetical protein
MLNLRGADLRKDVEERAGMTFLNLSEARAAEVRRQEEQTARTTQAIAPTLFGVGQDIQDATYRRITSPQTLRDLNPLAQFRMQQVCFYLAATAPFAKRFVELMTSYTVGSDGFKIIAEGDKDKKVQDVIDRFADDAINDLAKTGKEWSDELVRFGELCIPVAVNEVDGFVRLGYIDPQDIEAVEYGTMTSNAAGQQLTEISFPVAVRLRQRVGEQDGRRLKIVRLDEDVNSETYGRLVGDCFYLAINKAKTATRGISDLWCLADWIDVLDQIVFDGADRVRFLNSFLWHYTITGGDQKAIDDWDKKLRKEPVKQGGFKVTNEQIKIEAVTPDFKSAEFDQVIGNLKSYGLGGMGFPMHWFAEPGDANLATAKEMGEPTLKKLEDRQKTIVAFVRSIVNFVLDQAEIHGVLTGNVDRDFKIILPELSKKDLTRGTAFILAMANALTVGEDRGWLRGQSAAEAFYQALDEVGVEIDAADEYAAAQQELQDRRAREIDGANSQSNLANALKKLQGGDPNASDPNGPDTNSAGVVVQ